MAPRPDTGPDFIEALARGLDVIRSFRPHRPVMSLSDVATAADLARPTARRILLTLGELGYVRQSEHGFSLTPRVLELGVAYVRSMGLWDVARPHMERLVARTNESCSIAQLDGSDIVYVARVAVPKIVSLAVEIGTRFPALQTSLGKVQLAAMTEAELDAVLAQPTRSGLTPRWQPDRAERDAELREVRGAGLGAHRRAAHPRHPVGRRPAARWERPGDRRHQRQLPRRRDAGGAPARRPPPAAAAGGRRHQRRLRPARHGAAHGGLVRG